MSIVPMSEGERMLAEAKTPAESKQVEVIAAAAKAWHKERNDYQGMVNAIHLYMLARRKTTELIQPSITHGDHGRGSDIATSLEDYGFTKSQWHRRVKELEVSADELEAYFDQCIAAGWEPSLFGLLKHQKPQAPNEEVQRCTCCGKVL